MTDTNTSVTSSDSRRQAPETATSPVAPASVTGGAGSYLSAGRSLPTSAEDPIDKYIEIISKKDISVQDRQWILDQAESRFKNRRAMAYISLTTIIMSFFFILIGAVIDGVLDTNIVGKLNETANLIGGINALLTGIVAAYYGASTIRPSS